MTTAKTTKTTRKPVQQKTETYLVVITNPTDNSFRLFFKGNKTDAEAACGSVGDLAVQTGGAAHLIEVPIKDGIVSDATVKVKKPEGFRSVTVQQNGVEQPVTVTQKTKPANKNPTVDLNSINALKGIPRSLDDNLLDEYEY